MDPFSVLNDPRVKALPYEQQKAVFFDVVGQDQRISSLDEQARGAVLDDLWGKALDATPKEGVAAGLLRGVGESVKQLKPLGYGLLAGGAAMAEAGVGEGGLATGAKKWAVKNMVEANQEIAANTQPTDSLSYSLAAARDGDFSALGSWAIHGLGYVGGQGAQLLTGAGITKFAAQKAMGKVASSLASGMVQKEALAIAGGQAVTKGVLEQAAKNVAGKLGEHAFMAGAAFGMEGGEIGGGLAEQSVDENRTLTQEELGKMFLGTLAAGLVEYTENVLNLSALKGKIPTPFAGTPGIKGRIARGTVAAGAVSPVEAGQEAAQTAIERWAQGQDVTGEEARREYIDSAGMGALFGGAAFGGGLLSKAKSGPSPGMPGAQKDQSGPSPEILGAKSVDEAIHAAESSLDKQSASPFIPPNDQDIPASFQPIGQPSTAEQAAQVFQRYGITLAEANAEEDAARRDTERNDRFIDGLFADVAETSLNVARDERRKSAEAAFSETNALLPKSIRYEINKMEEDLANSEPAGLIEQGEGNDREVVGRYAATTPDWFKLKTLQDYDKKNGTSIAKNLNSKTFARILKLKRSGEALTSRQQEAWRYIVTTARDLHRTDPEVAQWKQVDAMQADGLEPVFAKMPAGNLTQGDDIETQPGGEIPADRYKVKGYENGQVVLQDGVEVRVDPWDQIDIAGRKATGIELETIDVPFLTPEEREAMPQPRAVEGASSSPSKQQIPPSIYQPKTTKQATNKPAVLSSDEAAQSQIAPIVSSRFRDRQHAESLRQMAADQIETIRQKGEQPRRNLIDTVAAADEYLSTGKVSEGLAGEQVFGHPQATNVMPQKYGNLIPIRATSREAVEKRLNQAQALFDELAQDIGKVQWAAKQGDKKAKAALKSKNMTEKETVKELLRDETLPALERMLKQFPGEQAQVKATEDAVPSASAAEARPASNWRDAYKRESDLFRRDDILRAIADVESTEQEMADILSLASESEYSSTNTLWAIAQNKASSADTKASALKLRDEIMSEPVLDDGGPDVALSPETKRWMDEATDKYGRDQEPAKAEANTETATKAESPAETKAAVKKTTEKTSPEMTAAEIHQAALAHAQGKKLTRKVIVAETGQVVEMKNQDAVEAITETQRDIDALSALRECL